MECKFIEFLYELLESDKTNIEIAMNNVINNELKDLMIYVADDYLIQQNPDWVNSLYEWNYKKTCCGGEKFYENLNFYYENNNQEMLRLYLISLQFGFRGYYNEFQNQIYLKYLETLKITFDKKSYVSFNSKFQKSKNFSFVLFFGLPILLYICYILCETYFISNITKNITNLYLKVVL